MFVKRLLHSDILANIYIPVKNDNSEENNY